jgi:LysR family hydrogen peroxide-inducible transcriptional activator
MVAGRLGQTLIPQMALDDGILADTGLIARPLEGRPARSIALAWRAGSPRAEEFRLLGRLLVEFHRG